ncbi:MAG: PAS domain-containing protein, partial [Oligosphaeraceae bacterium]|nr:PAS domain-containing protein [Oligosphaeraceae bacterium]
PAVSPVTLALQSGRIVELADHTDLISRSGQRYHIADSAAPIRNDGGEIAGAVLVFRDVTEQYRQRDMFNASLQSLEFATRLASMQTFECLPDEVPAGPDQRKFWVMDASGQPQSGLSWVHDEDIPLLSREWHKLLNGSVSVLRQSFRSLTNGKLRYYNIIASWRRYGSTNERRIFGVIQDITVREENKQKYLDNALLFQTIMDVLPCYFFIKDADHDFRYLQANDTFCDFVNCPKAELLGHNDLELRSRGGDRGQFAGDDRGVVAAGRKIESTEGALRSDGSFRYIRMVRMPYRRYDGVQLLIGLGFDVTELEQAKQEEMEARKMLSVLLDTLPVGIVAKDADNDFRYTLCNRFFTGLTGLEAQSILGLQDYEISIFSGQTAQLREEDARVMDSEQPVHQILETDFPGCGHQVFQVSKLPVKIPGGKNLLLSSFMDISSNYNLEQQQKALISKLNNFVESERILNNCLSQIVLETDFGNNLRQIFSTIRQQLRCDRVSVGTYNDSGTQYELQCEWTEPELQDIWEQDRPALLKLYSGLQDIYRQDRLLIISDLQECEYSAQLQGCRVRSLIAAPISVEGELWGIISFFFIREQRLFSDIDVNIIRSTSKIVALAQMQKKQLAAIHSADQEKRLILNNLQIPIWLYDAGGELLRVNSAVCRHFGITEAIALELGEDVLFGGLLAPRDRPLAAVLHSGTAAICEVVVNHFEFLVTAEPIAGADGKVINIIETAINITDINESKRQQELAMKAAQEADLAKTFFLATMSHEIRTPLNAVIGFSELLQRERLSRTEQQEYLQAIHYAGNALLQLINDILDLSKIEAGQMPIVLEKADFVVICQEVSSVFRHQAEEKNLSLEIAVEDMPLLFIDQLRMRQVLFNLLGNAVKFTDRGGVKISAVFHCGEDGLGELDFSVSDSGRGISEQD